MLKNHKFLRIREAVARLLLRDNCCIGILNLVSLLQNFLSFFVSTSYESYSYYYQHCCCCYFWIFQSLLLCRQLLVNNTIELPKSEKLVKVQLIYFQQAKGHVMNKLLHISLCIVIVLKSDKNCRSQNFYLFFFLELISTFCFFPLSVIFLLLLLLLYLWLTWITQIVKSVIWQQQ